MDVKWVGSVSGTGGVCATVTASDYSGSHENTDQLFCWFLLPLAHIFCIQEMADQVNDDRGARADTLYSFFAERVTTSAYSSPARSLGDPGITPLSPSHIIAVSVDSSACIRHCDAIWGGRNINPIQFAYNIYCRICQRKVQEMWKLPEPPCRSWSDFFHSKGYGLRELLLKGNLLVNLCPPPPKWHQYHCAPVVSEAQLPK